MFKRNSIVQSISINTIFFGSVFEIGDSSIIEADSKALAVQRRIPLFQSSEGKFSSYDIFSKNLLPLVPLLPSPQFQQYHAVPSIQVDTIKIKGISSAAVIHVGSTKQVKMNSRVKNIRNYFFTQKNEGGK